MVLILHVNSYISEDDLFQCIVDLFLAGTDTTTGSLRWLLLRLIHNPEVQKKCQQEIMEVLFLIFDSIQRKMF